MALDMLVKLYDLQPDAALDQKMADQGIVVRRLLAPELELLCGWIRPRFGPGWVSEATVAAANQPPSCFIATQDEQLVGFACHEATAKGFFGPTGVDEAQRGKGIGQALLRAALTDMRWRGYGYAVIGAPGVPDFYRKAVGATLIPGSSPGVYRGMLPLTEVGAPNASQTLRSTPRRGK